MRPRFIERIPHERLCFLLVVDILLAECLKQVLCEYLFGIFRDDMDLSDMIWRTVFRSLKACGSNELGYR